MTRPILELLPSLPSPSPAPAPVRFPVERPTLFDLMDGQPDPPAPTTWAEAIDGLIATAKRRGYKLGWVAYRLADADPPALAWHLVAKKLGYSPQWAERKIKENSAKFH